MGEESESNREEKENAEQKKRIAGWVKENKKANLERKKRNHAIIHLGLAALQMLKKKELKKEKIMRHVIVNKQKLIDELLDSEK